MKESIIILDTETTDLPKAEGTDLKFQPEIIEIFALKVYKKKKKFIQADEFHSLVKPQFPIPHFITKHTGINDFQVKNAPYFLEIYYKLARFFLGCSVLVAHNLSFDLKMILLELERIGRQFQFPFPIKHYCTVEQSRHIRGHRMKNDELYELATGKKIEGSHRAKADVLATFESYKWLVKQEC